MFTSGIWNLRILSGGIWNPGFWKLKETGMALAIGIQNPSSFDKESGIQHPRLSWIPLHEANNHVVFFKESQ